jgi:hypothetical protein
LRTPPRVERMVARLGQPSCQAISTTKSPHAHSLVMHPSRRPASMSARFLAVPRRVWVSPVRHVGQLRLNRPLPMPTSRFPPAQAASVGLLPAARRRSRCLRAAPQMSKLHRPQGMGSLQRQPALPPIRTPNRVAPLCSVLAATRRCSPRGCTPASRSLAEEPCRRRAAKTARRLPQPGAPGIGPPRPTAICCGTTHRKRCGCPNGR